MEHYHVMCKDRKLTIDEEELFENLDHLIEVWRSATGFNSSLEAATRVD